MRLNLPTKQTRVLARQPEPLTLEPAGMVPSILLHPDWLYILPYMQAIGAHPRVRLELSDQTPDDVKHLAIRMLLPCAHCKRTIQPFRARISTPKRGATMARGVYYSASCPPSGSVGCSRGGAARNECKRVRDAVDGYRAISNVMDRR